jgi:hypothetical protein
MSDARRDVEFKKRVGELLHAAGVSFKADMAVEGLQVDFVVTDEGGNFIIIEAKTWELNESNLTRAARQARLYCGVTKADKAYVVLNGLDKGNPEEGVLSIEEVADVLRSGPRVPGTRELAFRTFQPPERIVFAAMPFTPEYDDIFLVAMAHAAKSVNAVCMRVDHEDFKGDIVAEIKRLIHASVAVIADLSESRPNVLYEVGYAHALERPTIHICSTPMDGLPFDVRNWNTLKYIKGQTFRFQERLCIRLKAVLEADFPGES